MRSFKSYFYTLLVLAVISFSYVRTQQMDIYREIARSQQQIMTVYKYLLTDIIGRVQQEGDIDQTHSQIILEKDLVPGLYTLIISKDSRTFSGKLVLTH